jgi:hypothetical protein
VRSHPAPPVAGRRLPEPGAERDGAAAARRGGGGIRLHPGGPGRTGRAAGDRDRGGEPGAGPAGPRHP